MKPFMMLVWSGCIVALAFFASGCGSECGPGTTERDGQCVTEADGCGPGTILEDGQCVLAEGICSDGTALDPDTGACVPAETVCDRGTTFDHVRRTCVRDTEVLCGDGVVIDPETGECVASEDLCGPGLDFEPGSNRCVPAACAGDEVRIDGVCVEDGDQLGDNPDYRERENNDPDRGGLTDRLYLEEVDGGPLVFTGTIGQPEDLDGDGELDQDADVFDFRVTERTWLEVAVQSLGMPAPAFKIEGPDGFVRYSPVGSGADAAREVVLPRAGTYKMTVLPEIVLQTDGDINLLGSDDWDYVGSIRRVSFPEPTRLDVSSGSVSFDGNVLSLADNFYEIDDAEADDLFELIAENLGEDAQVVVQVWEDGHTLQRTLTAEDSNDWWVTAPDDTSVQILIDWVRVEGARVDYDLSARLAGKGRYVTMPANDYQTLMVPAGSRDTISASVLYLDDGPSYGSFDARISDAAGTVLANESNRLVEPLIHAIVWADETYPTRFINRTGEAARVLLMARVVSPVAFGNLADDVVKESSPRRVGLGEPIAYTFEVSADRYVEFVHDNNTGQRADVEVFDSDGNTLYQKDGLSPVQGVYQTDLTPFWYAPEPDEILVVLGFDAEVDGHSFSSRSVAAKSVGTLGPTEAVTTTSSTPVELGFSEFLLVDIEEPLAMAAAFTVNQYEGSLCTLYDTENTELRSGGSRLGEPCEVTATLESSGTHLARLTSRSELFTGYNARLAGIPVSEDFGLFAADSTNTSSILESFEKRQTYSASFIAQSGQLLEISHTNDDNRRVNIRLFDDNGVELMAQNYFATRDTWIHSDYAYWYVDQQATYNVEIEGHNTSTENEELTISSHSIDDFGVLDPGQIVSHGSTHALEEGQQAFHKFSSSSPSWIEIEAFGETASTDVDLAIYDVLMNDRHAVDNHDGVVQPKIRLEAGEYLIAVDADETTATYDLSVARSSAPSYVSSPALAIPPHSSVADTVSVSGCASVDTVEVYVEVSDLAVRDLNLVLESPGGIEVALHSRTGAFNDTTLLGWYPLGLTPSESLGTFTGTSGDGAWTLIAKNQRYNASDTGLLEHWALELTCS